MTDALIKACYELEVAALSLTEPLNGQEIRRLNQIAFVASHFATKLGIENYLKEFVGQLGQCRLSSLDDFKVGLASYIIFLRGKLFSPEQSFVTPPPPAVSSQPRRLVIGSFQGERNSFWHELDILTEFGDWHVTSVTQPELVTRKSFSAQIHLMTAVTQAFLESRFEDWRWRLAPLRSAQFVNGSVSGLSPAYLARQQQECSLSIGSSELTNSSASELSIASSCFLRPIWLHGARYMLHMDTELQLLGADQLVYKPSTELLCVLSQGEVSWAIPYYWVINDSLRGANLPNVPSFVLSEDGQRVPVDEGHSGIYEHWLHIDSISESYLLLVPRIQLLSAIPLVVRHHAKFCANYWMSQGQVFREPWQPLLRAIESDPLEFPVISPEYRGVEFLYSDSSPTTIKIDDGVIIDVLVDDLGHWVSEREILYGEYVLPVLRVGSNMQVPSGSETGIIVLIGQGEAWFGLLLRRPLGLTEMPQKIESVSITLSADFVVQIPTENATVAIHSHHYRDLWSDLYTQVAKNGN